MSRPALTAQQMYDCLGDVIRDGHGHYPVQLMLVVNGVTFAQDLTMCFTAQEYDGELVWVIAETVNAPEHGITDLNA